MSLVLIENIQPFDADKDQSINFVYTSRPPGTRLFRNELTVYDDKTNDVVYQETQVGDQRYHAIVADNPENKIENGGTYNCLIKVRNTLGEIISSGRRSFICLPTPILSFENLISDQPNIVPNSFINLRLAVETVITTENPSSITWEYEPLNEFTISVHDENNNLIWGSGVLHDETKDTLVDNLKNNSTYYLSATATTVSGMPLSVSDVLIQTNYVGANMTANLTAENIPAYGSVKITASDIDLQTDGITSVKIRRTQLGSDNWITIANIPVNEITSNSFIHYDITVRSNTDYQYILVPIQNGNNGNSTTPINVRAKFRGVFIIDKTGAFNTEIELAIPKQQNKPTSIVETIKSKYPFFISNGVSNYRSGTVDGIFVPIDIDNCIIDFKNSWKNRERFNAFLYNNLPKLLKYESGEMWLIAVSSNTITEIEQGHPYKVLTSFEWTEIDNCDSEDSLRKNNLI